MSSLHNFSLLKFTTFLTDMIRLHKAPICKTEHSSLPLQALPSWKAQWDNLPVVLTGAVLSPFSRVRLCVTLWTVAHQAPLSMVILQASTNLVSSIIVFLSLEPPPDHFWEFSSRQLLCNITQKLVVLAKTIYLHSRDWNSSSKTNIKQSPKTKSRNKCLLA